MQDDHLTEFLWYIPNKVIAGHRGDVPLENHNSLDTVTRHVQALEAHGWTGALIGTGWGRPDTFTVASALSARATRFEPRIAIRPGYWQPAQFATAAATLDHLSEERVRVDVVSGKDDLGAYGDSEGDYDQFYSRTRRWETHFSPTPSLCSAPCASVDSRAIEGEVDGPGKLVAVKCI